MFKVTFELPHVFLEGLIGSVSLPSQHGHMTSQRSFIFK